MALVLQQIRTCDGACCREKPRFPNAEGDDCIYRKIGLGKENSGCKLMTEEEPIPGGESVTWPGRSASETYTETCVNWPQNSSYAGRSTDGCCWQWIDNPGKHRRK